jgi:hypothetical protein
MNCDSLYKRDHSITLNYKTLSKQTSTIQLVASEFCNVRTCLDSIRITQLLIFTTTSSKLLHMSYRGGPDSWVALTPS